MVTGMYLEGIYMPLTLNFPLKSIFKNLQFWLELDVFERQGRRVNKDGHYEFGSLPPYNPTHVPSCHRGQYVKYGIILQLIYIIMFVCIWTKTNKFSAKFIP